MSQHIDTSTRRRAAKVWSRLLLEDTKSEPLASDLADSLKDLAEESVKRLGVRLCIINWHHAIAWRDYFVAAFDKVLRELPPKDCSVEDLRKKIAEFEGSTVPVQAALVPPRVNPVANKKRRATDNEDDVDTVFKMNKRTKTELETAGGSMTVYTKGPYTIRITEGGTPNAEFISNVPATVQVKIAPGSATNADVKADSNDDGSDD